MDYISVFTDPQRPADLEKFIGTLPKGAKAVARQVITWGDFQSTQLKDGKDVVLNVTALFAVEKVNIGIPSDPEQFIERAIAAGPLSVLNRWKLLLDKPRIEEMNL